MQEINFTKEHQQKLDTLLLDALYNRKEFKQKMGTVLNVFDLVHNTSINTISDMYRTTKKQASEIDDMDEFSLTPYQQRKQEQLKEQAELLKLLSGYLRNKQQQEAKKAKLAELKATYNDLKESAKTPEDRLKELEQQIASLEA